jgi:hypothetical protein
MTSTTMLIVSFGSPRGTTTQATNKLVNDGIQNETNPLPSNGIFDECNHLLFQCLKFLDG